VKFNLFASLASASIVLFANGCVSTDYKGETFKPTQDIKILYSRRDLPRKQYREIGILQITADTVIFNDSINQKIREAGMEKGADIAVIDFFNSRFTDNHKHSESCDQQHCHCQHEKDPYKYKLLIKATLFRKNTK
jgi:hypothetical protein